MIYSFLADSVVFIHFLYVIFAVGGEAAILAGFFFRWEWVRGLTFRLLHLTAVLIVAAQALMNIFCPLTSLEYNLREAAGQTAEREISFVGRLIRLIIYYDFPDWFFTFLYVGFAVLVIITEILIPPHRRGAGA